MYDKVGDKKTIQANKDVFWKKVQFFTFTTRHIKIGNLHNLIIVACKKKNFHSNSFVLFFFISGVLTKGLAL